MDWAELKFRVNNMNEVQLRDPVKVFDPYFMRTVNVAAIDTLESTTQGKPNTASPVVLVLSKNRE